MHAPDVTHLALADQVVQGAHDLFRRGPGRRLVDLVEVHVVGLELAQALLALAHDALAGRLLPQIPQVELAGEYEPLAFPLDGGPYELLALAPGVDV